MQHYWIEPEVAGGFGANTVLDRTVHPPRVIRLHYDFDGWLGDDLVTTFPVYLVTESLADAIRDCGLGGYEVAETEVTASETFAELYPGKLLPHFLWLKVNGEPGADDFGMSSDHRLVVSERALLCMKKFGVLENCDIAAEVR